MAMVQLEKLMSVNPFGKQIEVDRKPENVEKVEVTLDEKVEKAVMQYQQIDFFDDNFNEGVEQIFKIKMEILAPSQIEGVLSRILTTTNPKMLATYITKLYLSTLVQSSYDAGNNNFFLNMGDFPLVSLIKLKGTKKKPIHITINGPVRRFFGMDSSYCIFDIQGDAADYCGNKSNKCTYNIHGTVGNFCGNESKYCIFNIQGDANDCCGFKSENSYFNLSGNVGTGLGLQSKNSKYNVNGNAGSGFGSEAQKCEFMIGGDAKVLFAIHSENCLYTFKVFNEENYNLLVKELPKSNTVRLVDSAGGIIAEKKK